MAKLEQEFLKITDGMNADQVKGLVIDCKLLSHVRFNAYVINSFIQSELDKKEEVTICRTSSRRDKDGILRFNQTSKTKTKPLRLIMEDAAERFCTTYDNVKKCWYYYNAIHPKFFKRRSFTIKTLDFKDEYSI